MVQDCDNLLGIENPQLFWSDTVPQDTREPAEYIKSQSINGSMILSDQTYS